MSTMSMLGSYEHFATYAQNTPQLRLLVTFSACGGIRTGSSMPVLTAYFPAILGKGVGCSWANWLFYPSWNRLYRFTAYRQQRGRLPSTELTLRYVCYSLYGFTTFKIGFHEEFPGSPFTQYLFRIRTEYKFAIQEKFKFKIGTQHSESVYPKFIEPSPPLAQLIVRRSQCRESFFSVIYNKKFVICYCFDLICTAACEAEAHSKRR